ncbi:TIGR02117 family protein [Lyngbya sp. CCY1209]|uniref:TIGR02117 family protein n=1 Tax=Lyngbya sp. CCY1209 TaxID=2886103 RepID=UPI002D206058|nr:TIGR02117 family protein [Lyngbya sp. CCY1209]MEB3885294.1 TIGR02117 family protein [Lyngbya sp. CCY1209]
MKSKLLWILRWGGIGFLSLFVALLGGALLPRPWRSADQNDCAIAIYLSANPFHTDIFVPVKTSVFDWNQFLNLAEIGRNPDADYRYLALGWGDRQVYLQAPTLADLKPTVALRALLSPTASVMRVQGYETLPDRAESNCIKISRKNYLQLVKILKNSFATDAGGEPIKIRPGYGVRDSFYEAEDRYSIARNCNTWTAEALRSAQVRTPMWPTLPASILWQARSSCECDRV